MNSKKDISDKLLKFLEDVKANKTYGSVEIYFEAGQVTQITQRIISKIDREKNKTGMVNSPKKQPSTTSRHTDSMEFSEIISKL